MNNDKIIENNKSKKYYPERTVCDMTFDEETIHRYASEDKLLRICFKRCVFNLRLSGIISIVGCAFDECEFQGFHLSKFIVYYCRFTDCYFDSGMIFDVDVFYTVFSDCDSYELTLIDTDFSNCDFQNCEYDLFTKYDCTRMGIFDCKLWQSDEWIDLPDCSDCTADTPFFQLQKTIKEDWEEDGEEGWEEDAGEDGEPDEEEK